MTIDQFRETLTETQSPTTNIYLKALWLDGKGDWHGAHNQVDNLSGEKAAWVHAYLHRKEGDRWNANYWYNRAGRPMPDYALEQEWEELVEVFLDNLPAGE